MQSDLGKRFRCPGCQSIIVLEPPRSSESSTVSPKNANRTTGPEPPGAAAKTAAAPSPDDTTISRLNSVLGWSRKNPREAAIAGSCLVAGVLSLVLSSAGWVRALDRERAAAKAERLMQSELARSLSSAQSLQARVAEAAKTRDELRAAQVATVDSRARLEAENERLGMAIAAAGQALQTSQDAEEPIERKQSLNADRKAKLSALLKDLEPRPVASADTDGTDPGTAENRWSSASDNAPEPDTQ